MSEQKFIPKGRRTVQVIQPTEMVECVKVALRDTERDGKFTFRTFGKTIYKPKKNFLRENYKKKLGFAGVMTKEDYDNGLFKEYGLDNEKIKGFSTIDQQAKRIAELEAQIAEQSVVKKEPKEPKVKPETTETK